MRARGAAAMRGLAVAALAWGCAGAPPGLPPAPAPGARSAPPAVIVRELSTEGAVYARTSGARDPLGIDLAREIAAELERLGATAEAIEAGADGESNADVVVQGRLAEVDGGSRTARTLLPPGSWGAASCRLEIALRDSGGAELGRFEQQARARSTGWAEPGERVADRCLKVAAIEAARRIWTRLGEAATEGE
jgi:Domain of unknown function (DUF4410)